MSFQNLKVDELKDVAEFFVVDVEQANPEKGATKKELLAALAAGDEPVTWEDYNNVYLPAQGKSEATEPTPEPEPKEETPVVEAEEGQMVLVKYERKNPTWEVGGYLFSTAHPYKAVPEALAERLVTEAGGFRVALPSEVANYYN